MNDEETKVVNTTILNTGLAKPIAVSKEDALNLAHAQELQGVKKQQSAADDTPLASIIPTSKQELDEQKINEINDLMKEDYVKLVEVRHSKKTYILLILGLILIVGIIIFELIYFGGKMSWKTN